MGRFDDAGKLVAHCDRQGIAQDSLELSLARLEVDGIEAGRMHTDQDLARSGFGTRNLAKYRRFRSSITCQYKGLHGGNHA